MVCANRDPHGVDDNTDQVSGSDDEPGDATVPTHGINVTVSPRGEERIRNGHFWVYRADVAGGQGGARRRRARGWTGRTVPGVALFTAIVRRSRCAILTQHDVPVDRRFWRSRLEQAIAFRDRLGIDATAYRLVHGEGDLIPSLVVDRYGDYLVGAGAVAGNRSPASGNDRACSAS